MAACSGAYDTYLPIPFPLSVPKRYGAPALHLGSIHRQIIRRRHYWLSELNPPHSQIESPMPPDQRSPPAPTASVDLLRQRLSVQHSIRSPKMTPVVVFLLK